MLNFLKKNKHIEYRKGRFKIDPIKWNFKILKIK